MSLLTSGHSSHLAGHPVCIWQAAAKLYIAAPGGAVVYVNGVPAGDECGVSAWLNFENYIPYSAYDLAGLADSARSSQTVTIKIGSGFFSDSLWRANDLAGPSRSSKYPVARLLL